MHVRERKGSALVHSRIKTTRDAELTRVMAFFFPLRPIVLPAFLAGVPVVVDEDEELGVTGGRLDLGMDSCSISTYELVFESFVGVGVEVDVDGVAAASADADVDVDDDPPFIFSMAIRFNSSSLSPFASSSCLALLLFLVLPLPSPQASAIPKLSAPSCGSFALPVSSTGWFKQGFSGRSLVTLDPAVGMTNGTSGVVNRVAVAECDDLDRDDARNRG